MRDIMTIGIIGLIAYMIWPKESDQLGGDPGADDLLTNDELEKKILNIEINDGFLPYPSGTHSIEVEPGKWVTPDRAFDFLFLDK